MHLAGHRQQPRWEWCSLAGHHSTRREGRESRHKGRAASGSSLKELGRLTRWQLRCLAEVSASGSKSLAVLTGLHSSVDVNGDS